MRSVQWLRLSRLHTSAWKVNLLRISTRKGERMLPLEPGDSSTHLIDGLHARVPRAWVDYWLG